MKNGIFCLIHRLSSYESSPRFLLVWEKGNEKSTTSSRSKKHRHENKGRLKGQEINKDIHTYIHAFLIISYSTLMFLLLSAPSIHLSYLYPPSSNTLPLCLST